MYAPVDNKPVRINIVIVLRQACPFYLSKTLHHFTHNSLLRLWHFNTRIWHVIPFITPLYAQFGPSVHRPFGTISMWLYMCNRVNRTASWKTCYTIQPMGTMTTYRLYTKRALVAEPRIWHPMLHVRAVLYHMYLLASSETRARLTLTLRTIKGQICFLNFRDSPKYSLSCVWARPAWCCCLATKPKSKYRGKEIKAIVFIKTLVFFSSFHSLFCYDE